MALIPARGGSIGVKGKNIRKLKGKPLILHTLDFAIAESWFDQILVTTDDSRIASEATRGVLNQTYFDELPEDAICEISDRFFIHKRKLVHSETLSPIKDFLFEFVEDVFFKNRFEFIMMLQPTSPFRRHEEVVEIKKLVSKVKDFTSLVSITSVGGFHPDRMYRMKNNYLDAYIDQNGQDNKPRQLLEELYIKDGAYYLFRPEILRCRTLLGKKPLPLKREGLCTVNIDDEIDFAIAELITDPYN